MGTKKSKLKNEDNKINENSVVIPSRDTRDTNQEEITLIWFGTDSSSEDDDIKNSLRSINDFVLFYDDVVLCNDYICSIKEEKIFLIVNTLDALKIVPLIHSLDNIDSIFLFNKDYTSCDEIMTEKYAKIINAYTNKELLINDIRKHIFLSEKQSAAFNLYDRKQKSHRNLSNECGSFLFFQMFKNALMSMPRTTEAKIEMVERCQEYYRGNQKELANIVQFQLTYKSSDAIKWYTKDSFLYRLINKALRSENIEALYTFRFYITDLCTSLAVKYHDFKKNYRKSPIIMLYRGLKQPKDEIKAMEENVGNLMSTNGFLSTSRSRVIAYEFAKKETKRTDLECLLFEIEMDLRLEKILLSDISEYSDFPAEEEVLFDLGAAFKIESCTYDESDNLWVVKAKATDKGAELADEYIEFKKKKMAQSNIVLMFGHLLADMGEYEKSLKYFEKILREVPNDEELACVYHNIGRAYRLQGNYEKAIINYDRAYKMHMNSKPARFVSAAKTLNGLAVVYNEIGEYDEANKHYLNALAVYKKALPKNHIDIASTLNNLGNFYHDNGEYKLAIKYLMEAKQINEKILPKDHPDTARVLNNIGNVYYKTEEYEKAYEHYVKAWRLKEKALPADHPDIARSLDNIGLTYYKYNDFPRAIEYHVKALQMTEKTLPLDHPLITNIKEHLNTIQINTLRL